MWSKSWTCSKKKTHWKSHLISPLSCGLEQRRLCQHGEMHWKEGYGLVWESNTQASSSFSPRDETRIPPTHKNTSSFCYNLQKGLAEIWLQCSKHQVNNTLTAASARPISCLGNLIHTPFFPCVYKKKKTFEAIIHITSVIHFLHSLYGKREYTFSWSSYPIY